MTNGSYIVPKKFDAEQYYANTIGIIKKEVYG